MPKAGFAYACPSCRQPLRPHDGPWDIYHCLPCNRSVDLYRDPEPDLIRVAVDPEPYNPHQHVVVLVPDKKA